MRTTLILGTLLALFGVASVVQASDRSSSRDGVQVSREASHGDRHDRSERKDGSRERHESREERHEARDGHHESRENHESREGHQSREMRR